MEAMKNIIAEFTVTIPKTAKTLAKFVSKDDLRPLLQYVVIMPGKGIATATDAHILQTVAIDARGEFAPDTIAYIDAKTFAKLAGHEITVSLTEEEREVIEVKTYRQFGQAQRQEYKVRRVFTVTHIYCGKTQYEVEVEAQGCFPDVQRAIPRDENMKRIELTDDGLAGLKSLCKVAKCNYILLSVAEGSEYMTVCAEAEQYENRRQGAILPLAHRAESSANIAFCPQLLAATLDGCNGAIGIDDYSRPAKVYGDAEATIIMPVLYNDDTAAYADELTRELPADTAFSDDASEAVRQLQGAALGYWEYITECLKDIPAGNYTASEVCNRKKLGIYIDYPMSEEFEQPLAVKAGNIHIMVPYREIFDVLAKWEKLAKVKTIFTAGSVDEITAPVLAPNKEGNLSGKKMKLHKIGDGWYSVARRKTGYQSPIYREVNGHIIFIREMPNSTIDNPEDFAKWADDKAEQIPSLIMKQAKESEYFAALAKCIGLEEAAIAATPSETSRISTETAETVNVSAEEKKAAVAAKKPIWKQANELAGEYEKRGYQFVYNERTKLCYLTIPGHIFVDGSQCTTELTYVMTGKIDDFRDVPKAVGEYNAMYCAKYAERCPQMLAYLPTEPRETVNVSVEGENEPQAAKYKPYTTRAEIIALLESEHGIEYDAGEVVYLKDGCVAEDLSDEGEWRIYLDADSDKCIDVIAIQPPQSPETPQVIEYTTDTPEARETARKLPNRTIGGMRTTRRDTLRNTLRSATYVPHECSTANAPPYW